MDLTGISNKIAAARGNATGAGRAASAPAGKAAVTPKFAGNAGPNKDMVQFSNAKGAHSHQAPTAPQSKAQTPLQKLKQALNNNK